ncbi:hypothetical protein JCM9534A_15860 [Catenuloplanes indicus JCM 9534]
MAEDTRPPWARPREESTPDEPPAGDEPLFGPAAGDRPLFPPLPVARRPAVPAAPPYRDPVRRRSAGPHAPVTAPPVSFGAAHTPAGPPPGRRPPPTAPVPGPDADGPSGPPGAPERGSHAGVLVGTPVPVTGRRAARGVPVPEYPVLVLTAVVTVAAVAGRALAGGLPQGVLAAGVVLPAVTAAAAGAALLRASAAGVPLHTFRVRTPDGRTDSYAVKGTFPAGVPAGGEIVRVRAGRFRRAAPNALAHRMVSAVEILAAFDGPVVRVVTARLPRAVRVARLLTRTGVVVLSGFLLWVMLAV